MKTDLGRETAFICVEVVLLTLSSPSGANLSNIFQYPIAEEGEA